MRYSKDGMPKIFKFLSCALSVVTGESGNGKSFFAMWCAWRFIEAGGYVFSNVVVAQKRPDGTWDDKKRPERYYLVESWAEFFTRLGEVLVKWPTARCLLIIDEAASSLSSYDWQSETAKILRSSVTLKRKWGELHVMVISMQNSLILKAIRETGEEGGLLDIKFLKNKWAIERYGEHLLALAHEHREIVVVDRVELEEPEAYTLSVAEQLAKPVELCQPGDYAYATLAQSTWGLGLHSYTEKGRWSWLHFLSIQSGIWPDAIPGLIYAFWHGDPSRIVKGEPVPDVSADQIAPEPKPRPVEQHATTTQHDVKPEVERLLLERGRDANLSQIAREVGCTQPFVSQTKKEMMEGGKL